MRRNRYVNGAASAGVTLQGTLLNHTVTVQIIEAFTTIYGQVLSLNGAPIPMIFGETNSLWGEGKAGLSNTFGAALWAIDFYLYAASNNISRIHMHQGTDFRVSTSTSTERPDRDAYSHRTVRLLATSRNQYHHKGNQGPLLR